MGRIVLSKKATNKLPTATYSGIVESICLSLTRLGIDGGSGMRNSLTEEPGRSRKSRGKS